MFNGHRSKAHTYYMITKSLWKIEDFLQCVVVWNFEFLPQLSRTFGIYPEVRTLKGHAKRFEQHEHLLSIPQMKFSVENTHAVVGTVLQLSVVIILANITSNY